MASILLTYGVYTQTFYPALMMDEWGTLAFYFDKGFWPSVFCQHNNHVVLLPGAFARLLYLATDADPFIRGLATLLCAGLLGVCVGYLAVQANTTGHNGSHLVRASRFVVAVAFTLWLVCYPQLFWGMATYGYFPLLFGFAAVLTLNALLQKPEKPGAWLLLPVLLATASALSFSYGVASWGALALVMILHRKPWHWIAATLLLGLAVIMSFRLSLPHCRPLDSLAPDISSIGVISLLQGLVSLLGSAWAHSLAPLVPPSPLLASVLGALGLVLLCWLSFKAWKTEGIRPFGMLVTGCWLAAGMLLLVALGRNPESFALANQMIAPRFMHLSIFFWTCLLAAASSQPGAGNSRSVTLWGAVHTVVVCYLLFTALLAANWMSSMRASELHFTSTEIKVEAIRTWIAPPYSGNVRTTNILGVYRTAAFTDNFGKLREKEWDYYRAFPSSEFPDKVVDLPDESATGARYSTALIMDAAKKTKGGTWTLNGSLSDTLPPHIRHLFFARGERIVGYGVPAPYPAFQNKPREPFTGLAELPSRLSAAIDRVLQLLGRERYWIGVSNANASLGEWRCELRSESTLLCRAPTDVAGGR